MLAKPARRGILIEHLLQPEAYPHEVTELRLLETHISWVILTGPYAYKIKKPVRFDFVDYSSLSERQRFCELELALNRRFAPELYINVVPIYEIDGRRAWRRGLWSGPSGPLNMRSRCSSFRKARSWRRVWNIRN